MRRRQVLASGVAGLAAGVAGCSAPSGDGDGGADGRSVGDPATVDDRTVTLEAVSATRFLRTGLASAHTTITAERDRQYVVAALSVEGETSLSRTRAAARLLVDGDASAPVRETVLPFEEPTHVGFALPAPVDVDELALEWRSDGDRARWRVPDRVPGQLRSPPDFEVQRFELPETAVPGEAVSATLAVENVGDGDGTFWTELGALTLSDQPEIALEVPVGERTTTTRAVDLYADDGSVAVELDWGWDRIERTVRVE